MKQNRDEQISGDFIQHEMLGVLLMPIRLFPRRQQVIRHADQQENDDQRDLLIKRRKKQRGQHMAEDAE